MPVPTELDKLALPMLDPVEVEVERLMVLVGLDELAVPMLDPVEVEIERLIVPVGLDELALPMLEPVDVDAERLLVETDVTVDALERVLLVEPGIDVELTLTDEPVVFTTLEELDLVLAELEPGLKPELLLRTFELVLSAILVLRLVDEVLEPVPVEKPVGKEEPPTALVVVDVSRLVPSVELGLGRELLPGPFEGTMVLDSCVTWVEVREPEERLSELEVDETPTLDVPDSVVAGAEVENRDEVSNIESALEAKELAEDVVTILLEDAEEVRSDEDGGESLVDEMTGGALVVGFIGRLLVVGLPGLLLSVDITDRHSWLNPPRVHSRSE